MEAGSGFQNQKIQKLQNNFVLKPNFWEQNFESHYLEANVATDMGGNET